ncbi:hypothetical protein NDI56_15150 [Haloarcula sp. S1CR25-12]|uniref:Uncharacterized protein n=1 Tax=Haloarcula saliterrae TaxID=2950534 RepID=A0ABU2FEQ1_9EURY|nr:hypothetical protein [Haloarcula sp. S1CR25-12]MDS0260743.1 hypothetical protein [Haloarcula sp. S1CR25-12]
MCHHRGDIPGEISDWTTERTDTADEAEDEELPEFLNEAGDDLSVLTDGGDEH